MIRLHERCEAMDLCHPHSDYQPNKLYHRLRGTRLSSTSTQVYGLKHAVVVRFTVAADIWDTLCTLVHSVPFGLVCVFCAFFCCGVFCAAFCSTTTTTTVLSACSIRSFKSELRFFILTIYFDPSVINVWSVQTKFFKLRLRVSMEHYLLPHAGHVSLLWTDWSLCWFHEDNFQVPLHVHEALSRQAYSSHGDFSLHS